MSEVCAPGPALQVCVRGSAAAGTGREGTDGDGGVLLQVFVWGGEAVAALLQPGFAAVGRAVQGLFVPSD